MTARQYTILVVDDSAEDRDTYRRYLKREVIYDYKIVEVDCGEDGLEQLASIEPDLILLDYMLPDFDGLEFIEELKTRVSNIPPIIMLTGQGNEMIAVEAMKGGVKDYLGKGRLTPEILTSTVKNVLQQDHLQRLLTKSFQQQQLIAQTALCIRQSLDSSEILNTAVREVQLLLDCDRVVAYHFTSDMAGNVVAESVKPGWTKSLGQKVVDTCFQRSGTLRYEQGKTRAIDDVYDGGLSKCHLALLEQFEVKANIIVPILLTSQTKDKSELWGLLIAHQCSHSRHWETNEVEFLNKLAVQMSIAIQQAELIDSLKTELQTRRSLEAALAQKVHVIEASKDYIGMADLKGRVIWNNPSMKQLIGINDDGPGKLSIADYHPAWALNVIQEKGIPTAMSKGTWLGETALIDKNGREIPVSQLIIAHRSATGHIDYLSTVIRDLSLQKEVENSLKEKALELQWSNKELLKTTTLLKKRNQELDRFAYVTSHDLKAPLRAIANLATWLREDLEGQIPEENQQQLKLMHSRVQRMDNLIQGLLEYSRIGKKDTPVERVNVEKLLIDAIDSLSPPSGFEISLPPDLPTINTQPLLLQQVFANLIGNAVKYHPQREGKVTISIADRDKFYRFGVTDDGMGIDPQYHDRIFTIFQTLQARDTIESTGIGLSIVKKIVESQGGKVTVESQLGQGATFYFTWRK